MRELDKMLYADWGGHYVKLTWRAADTPPADLNKVTSVHSVCMDGDKVMLVHVANRGFNFPGGHVEEGETPEETITRECMEEGYVQCRSFSLVGMIEVSHEENPLFDPNGKYPLIGYQLFYAGVVSACLPYLRENECSARIWVEPQQIPYVINDHELAALIVEEAVSKLSTNSHL